MEVITVRYSCHECGLEKVSCEVPARTTEGVLYWTRAVLGWALKADHVRRSPSCGAQSVDEVMVPVSGATQIGGASVQ